MAVEAVGHPSASILEACNRVPRPLMVLREISWGVVKARRGGGWEEEAGAFEAASGCLEGRT